MDVSGDEIRKAVIGGDDFAHEMRVRRVLSSIRGAQVAHGGTYTDEIQGKPRQFDFRVTVENDTFVFRLAVEAKRLDPVAPLVVCGIARPGSETGHHIIVSRSDCSGIGDTFIDHAMSFTRTARSAYDQGEFVGKSVLRLAPNKSRDGGLVRSSDADIYERWAQALASAADLCSRAAHANASPNQQRHPAILSVVIPLVVVPDGSLWKVAYDESGELAADPIAHDELTFFVGRQYDLNSSVNHRHPVVVSHLHFCTLRGFEIWARRLDDFANATGKELRSSWFPPEALRNIE